MKVQIDLTGFLNLLKTEGTAELNTLVKGGKFGGMSLIHNWNGLLSSLDLIVGKLAKGTEMAELVVPAKQLAKQAAALSSLAMEVLTFIPGPVGIVASIIAAIVCLCTLPFPVNVGNALLELLGCIPGGKVVAKTGTKLAPKIKNLLVPMLEKHKVLVERLLKEASVHAEVKTFIEKNIKVLGRSNAYLANKEAVKAYGKTLHPTPSSPPLTSAIGPYPSIFNEGGHLSGVGRIGQPGVSRQVGSYRIPATPGSPLSNVYSHLWK